MDSRTSTNQRTSELTEAGFVLEVYRAYREKVTHEDGLVHQRMIWFVTLQALLFTSFAILLGDNSSDAQEMWQLNLGEMRKLALIFASVGMASAIAAALSVGAAFWAIDQAFKDWETTVRGWDEDWKSIAQQLPSVVGAGKLSGTHVYGKLAGSMFPLFVGLAWFAVIREVYGNSVILF